jgi:hypothetical protein
MNQGFRCSMSGEFNLPLILVQYLMDAIVATNLLTSVQYVFVCKRSYPTMPLIPLFQSFFAGILLLEIWSIERVEGCDTFEGWEKKLR